MIKKIVIALSVIALLCLLPILVSKRCSVFAGYKVCVKSSYFFLYEEIDNKKRYLGFDKHFSLGESEYYMLAGNFITIYTQDYFMLDTKYIGSKDSLNSLKRKGYLTIPCQNIFDKLNAIFCAKKSDLFVYIFNDFYINSKGKAAEHWVESINRL